MDGAKSVTDTSVRLKDEGREASCQGKSILVRGCEPDWNENLGDSRNLVE